MGCLSKGGFERRASNGSDAFSLLISLDVAKFVMLSCLPLIETMCQKCRRTTDEYCKMSTSGWRALLKNVFVHRNEKRIWTGIHFPKVLCFFPSWLCHFKGLFIPVWREILRSIILPVTSWQLTNRTVSDISRRSRHSICQSFFPAWIYNMILIHSDETGRPQDVVARSFASRPHALKLASLTFSTYKESTCSTSRTGREGREL